MEEDDVVLGTTDEAWLVSNDICSYRFEWVDSKDWEDLETKILAEKKMPVKTKKYLDAS